MVSHQAQLKKHSFFKRLCNFLLAALKVISFIAATKHHFRIKITSNWRQLNFIILIFILKIANGKLCQANKFSDKFDFLGFVIIL